LQVNSIAVSKRIDIYETEPKAFEAMMGLEKYLAASALSETHKFLVKIRASQINGCAYCISMHVTDARKSGMTEKQVYLLNAWRESSHYSSEEKLVLAMTEEITHIDKAGLPDDSYNKAIEMFGPNYTAQLITAIATINAWNRIVISLRKEAE
jgi:AhpD family alkylhydroperoxidase